MSLFDSISIGKVRFKNRLLVNAHVYNNAKTQGNLSISIVENVIKLAKMGVGAIILDSAYIISQGRSHQQQLSIEEETLLNYKKLTEHTKNEGVVLGIRITHCGAKTSQKICGEQPVSSSNSISFGKNYTASRSFDKDDVEELLMRFKHSAELAEEAGFEIIEVNGGNQELLDQCFQLKFNKRNDRYGGILKNRLRLLRKIIREVKSRTKNALIGYYFPVFDRQNGVYSPKTLEEIYQILEKEGIDIIHPTSVQILNPMFQSNKNILHWTQKMTNKKIIADGNVKSFNVLKSVETLNIASLISISNSIYSIPNWYNTLKKKM